MHTSTATCLAAQLRALKTERADHLRAADLPLSTSTHFDREIDAIEEELFA